MTQLGYKLMTETHDPRDLVRNACAAESAGFDFVSISDHYHPWLKSHGHSSFAWSVMGALAHATKTIGISTWVGYSANEGQMLTLAILDAEHADVGNEVTFVWGEEGGGSKKPTVERHRQAEIRVVVSSVPYSKVVRETYAEGWRSKGIL